MSELKAKKFHIKKGDTVMVLSGDEKGKTGKVLRVVKKKESAVVEKLNFVKRAVRPGHPTAPQGGVIEREAPIHLSKLMLVCPKCAKPTRIMNKRLEKGKKVRVCLKCSEQID